MMIVEKKKEIENEAKQSTKSKCMVGITKKKKTNMSNYKLSFK